MLLPFPLFSLSHHLILRQIINPSSKRKGTPWDAIYAIYFNIVLKGCLFLFSINNHVWRSSTKCSINLGDLLQQTNAMYSILLPSFNFFFIFQLYFTDSSCKNQGEQFQATQKSRSGYVSYNVFQQKSNVFVANCSDLKTWKKVKSERYLHLWFSFTL